MKKFSTSNQKEKFTKKDPFFRVFKRFLTLFLLLIFLVLNITVYG